MILTDTDLQRLLKEGELKITPFQDARLTPVGYNLSIGEYYLKRKGLSRVNLKADEEFVVPSGEPIAIRSLEKLTLPNNGTVSALVQSKVKMINEGFAQISTTIDPDHSGPLLVIVQNISGKEAKLTQGRPFCTVVFFRNHSPATLRSNNTYDEYENMTAILAAWSTKRGSPWARVWQLVRPTVPIAFLALSSAVAFAFLGSGIAFAGVVTAVATISILMEKLLNK